MKWQNCKYQISLHFRMKRFLKFWCIREPEWDPSTLLYMDGQGPIPKIPPLEPFAMAPDVKNSSLSSIVSAYIKMCDFLLNHLYATYFLKMDDNRYSRCRDNLQGQREMATEVSKNVQKEVKRQQLKNKKNALKVGKWSERPDDLFKLMGKFCNLPIVQHHLENMGEAFEVKLRYTSLSWFRVKTRLGSVTNCKSNWRTMTTVLTDMTKLSFLVLPYKLIWWILILPVCNERNQF